MPVRVLKFVPEDLDGIPGLPSLAVSLLLSLLRQFLVVLGKAGGFYKLNQSQN